LGVFDLDKDILGIKTVFEEKNCERIK